MEITNQDVQTFINQIPEPRKKDIIGIKSNDEKGISQKRTQTMGDHHRIWKSSL